jgi:fatty acid amide hydrolase
MTDWCRNHDLRVVAYWRLLEEQNEYRRRFLAEFAKRKFDAIVCPANALPAFPHGTFYGNFSGSYTLLYNLLGMPAGVIPATRVRPDEESDRDLTRDAVIRTAATVEKCSAGLPIGVQVVARHWREDIVLRVMAALERNFKFAPHFPLLATNKPGILPKGQVVR